MTTKSILGSVPAGTLVAITRDQWKPIEQIQIGDMVLSGEGFPSKVIHVGGYQLGERKLYYIDETLRVTGCTEILSVDGIFTLDEVDSAIGRLVPRFGQQPRQIQTVTVFNNVPSSTVMYYLTVKPRSYIVDGGFIIHEDVPIVLVPKTVTPRQARLALLEANLLDAVEQIINGFPPEQRRQAQIEWEFASEIDRINPLFFVIIQVLGLTEQDIDNLFIAAAKL